MELEENTFSYLTISVLTLGLCVFRSNNELDSLHWTGLWLEPVSISVTRSSSSPFALVLLL